MPILAAAAAAAVATSLPVPASIGAADPEADPEDLPRIAPLEPAEALASFRLAAGFRIELAAAEPLVADPIAMAFDEDGALFVVEMRGYSERRDEGLGRVRRLVDADDDGVYDEATTWIDGLRWPTAVACWRGGVFVAATPDLLYCRDEDGDGAADTREVVFTGFGEDLARLNVQALVNSLRWGPDGRIWGATAGNGGRVRRPQQAPSEAIPLRNADFSFDPVALDLRAEAGTAQYGLSFDRFGRRFVCSNSNHLIWVARERHRRTAGPLVAFPHPLIGIAEDGPAAEVFRISGDEPWRIVRTRWRIAGVVGGPVEGGGRVSGYFTAATGVTLYTGDAYGEHFLDNAFVGDAGSNLVHRKVVRTPDDRVEPIGERPADERDHEFLASTDNWFRPVSFAVGPDGCLHVADMYREIIEHPWSLPPGIKRHLDLNSGNDRGRIYRIVPDDHRRRPTPRLSEADSAALEALLSHPNGWHRRTAARLLQERSGVPVRWTEPFPPGSASAARDALPAAVEAGSEPPETLKAVREAIERFPDDPWLRLEALALLRTPDSMLDLWQALPSLRADLARMIGRSGDRHAISRVAIELADSAEPSAAILIGALIDGLDDGAESVEPATLERLFARTRAELADATISLERRRAAARILSRDPSAATTTALEAFAIDRASDEPRLAAAGIEALGRRLAPETAARIARKASAGLHEGEGRLVLETLLASPRGASALLELAGEAAAPPLWLTDELARRLRAFPDPEVRTHAMTVLGVETVAEPRADVLARFKGALTTPGDPQRGQATFASRCSLCHRAPDGSGKPVGPDLASYQGAGRESILANLIDPSAEVAPSYLAYSVERRGGEVVVGIIVSEDATHLTIRDVAGNDHRFPRRDVVSMSSIGRSLMPDGLEAGLSVAEMADLLAFITTGTADPP